MAATLDPRLPAYEPSPVAPPACAGYVLPDGTVRIVSGNRGIGAVLEGFNALFSRTHPGTRFRVDYNREGNSVNMAALTHGITLVGPMGREANGLEKDMYRNVVGGDPLYVSIAHGTLTSPRMTAGLAIYVHKDNPVRKLTMDQLARIFTTGAPGGDVTHWGQVGATGEWASRPIHTYGTPEASGYGYFMLKNRWGGRPFAPGYESFDLAAQIVKRVGEDAYGIGFAGQGFLTRATALVALARSVEGPYMEGTEEEVASGRYPLGRSVDLAIRRVPGEPLDPFVVEYLRLILSREGQAIVAAELDGFVPLNAGQVAAERAKLASPPRGARAAAPRVPDDGSVYIVGDKTMEPLLAGLNELFARSHPEIRFTMLLREPPTGIDGITAGVSLLAPVAHDAWELEIEPFRRLNGYRPLDVRIGRLGRAGPGRQNPPAVYVNTANPLRQLTLGELARVFTAGHASGDLRRWSQLGLGGDWAKHAIHLYGTRDDGGSLTTLRASRFGNRPFARGYEALPEDGDVLEALAGNRYAIGIVGFVDPARIPANVRMLAISEVPDGYPFAPYLHFYVKAPPGRPLDPVARDYIRLALSREGQELIARLGQGAHAYAPLSAEEARKELAKVEP